MDDDSTRLVVAMAHRCRSMILQNREPRSRLPKPLRPRNLEWMCGMIQTHAQDWSATKLHRWIGFVQAGMMANGIIDVDGAQTMFDDAKASSEDLLDHLDPTNAFELEIGGEG